MTTAEAVEAIKDAGKFEILATRVLRITDEDCRLLEHEGVNAAGKTVPNPVDGFCRVPGTAPPRFVITAFTTDKVKSLQRKWLFDHSKSPRAKKATDADDGDLIKIGRKAEALRKDYPDAIFVVHLCTNKQPGDQLINKVITRGEELGLDVRFLTRSRLRDVLDVNPDGQWLRKEHLGIQAERLSAPLLSELSVKSLEQYGKEFLITDPRAFITTFSELALADALTESRCICVVAGISGSGKSVACYQTLRNYIAQGGVGLWVPGELAAHATSLEEAIGLTLRSLHPTIEPAVATVAMRLGSAPHGLMVIVDDINRGGRPTETLRKILAWGRPPNNEKNSTLSSFKIIVPVWDLYWAPLDKQFGLANWLVKVPVNLMEEDEALACLTASLGWRSELLAEADRRQIVEALGYDPILIAMYADSFTNDGKLLLPTLQIDVIDHFIEAAEAEVATSAGYLQSEYDLALSHLAALMLNQHDLYPRWEDVLLWLPENETKAIRELARLGKVCRVSGRAGENRFEFRHDRILERFLVRALRQMLINLESNSDVLSDPFYTSFVGQALALGQPSDELIAWIEQHAPSALIASLKFLPALKDTVAIRIADAAKRWLESAFNAPGTPPVVIFQACRLLEKTDTPLILTVTQSFAQHVWMVRARLANGDAAAGIVDFSYAGWFAPAMNDRGLDQILSRAIHRYRRELIADCTQMLQSADSGEAVSRGALILAGFIADAALSDPVRNAWELAIDKSKTLLPALWAGLRCAGANPASVLDGMMTTWAALPDDNIGGLMSKRLSIAQELQFAIKRGIPEQALKYVLSVAIGNAALRRPITFMLVHLDDPLAVKFLVEEAANIARRINGTNRFSHWIIELGDSWDPSFEMTGKRLRSESIEAIRSFWESKTADDQLRKTAFRLWLRAVDKVEVLCSVPPDHPQFEDVLWRRARLGDIATIPFIKPLLKVDHRWFSIISRVWTDQFSEILDDALLNLRNHTPIDYSGGTTDEHHMLAKLIRDMPADVANRLLVKHWDHLKFSRLFVQAALYIGSPDCIELASAAVNDYPGEVNPFEHLHFFFGFFEATLMKRIEYRHLEVLRPYLKKLDVHTLTDMAEFCQRRSYHDWGRTHLRPEFDCRREQISQPARERKEYAERVGAYHFPSDSDLLNELDRIEQLGSHYSAHLYHWLEGFQRRQDDESRWRYILNEWLSRKPTIERFRPFSQAILQHATRADIGMLYKHQISGDTEEIDRLRANASIGIKQRSLR